MSGGKADGSSARTAATPRAALRQGKSLYPRMSQTPIVPIPGYRLVRAQGNIPGRAVFRAHKSAVFKSGKRDIGVKPAVEFRCQPHDVAPLRERRPASQQTLDARDARNATGGDVPEAVVGDGLPLVPHERFDVVVGQVECPHLGQRSAQLDARLRDHPELTQSATHAVEQHRILRSRATQLPGVSGHHNKFIDVVRLRAVAMRRDAETRHRQRSADGDIKVRREHRWEIAPGPGVVDKLAPCRSRLNADGAVPDFGDAVETGHVEQDAAVCQRLPGLGVTRAADSDGAARTTGEVQRSTHILRRPGSDHRTRDPADHAAEVGADRLAAYIVIAQRDGGAQRAYVQDSHGFFGSGMLPAHFLVMARCSNIVSRK